VTGFRTKTFGWLLPRLPLKWAYSPDDISTWRALGPDYYVPFIVKALAQGKIHTEPVIPEEKNRYEQYPRLVRAMYKNSSSTTQQAISLKRFLEVPVTQRMYTKFMRMIPNFFETQGNIKISCQDILDSAEELGMLLHPKYGDSLFGWVSTVLQFQLIAQWEEAIRTRAFGQGDHYFDKQYKQISERWKSTVVLVQNCHDPNSSIIEFRTDRIPLPFTQSETNDKFVEYSEILEVGIRGWLQREIGRALDTYGHSESHFTFQYFDHNKLVGGNILSNDENDFRDRQGGLQPFFSIKSGLYAFLLYAQLLELDREKKMEVCPGCSQPFVLRHGNQKYCLNAEGKSDRCRKKAQRQKKRTTDR
jgi:hypothetical protein